MTKTPHHVDFHVGKRIREQRYRQDMTQTELAQAVSITFQQLQKYENATNRVAASRLWEIADVLGTPVEWFFPPLPSATTNDPCLEAWLRFYWDTRERNRALMIKLAAIVAKHEL